ncbi:hypothetical protein RM53_13550 [Brevundimonas nasdae]|uniref:HIRAN domain-containing protein n=1 Tax=Brevundimonas nasdae TaxID=172043 RepID=A0A0B4CV67_9CAUL|nr:hypothetical protein [Brevundimonas nasdae]KIC56025.1 hypothetical protein RM53_13550 [Brevundimonas nasdae]
MEVVGESHYQSAIMAQCGSHTRFGVEHECIATLRPDPHNRFDTNAVEVLIGGQRVGFLSREQAPRMKEALAAVSLASATCGARINGGWRTNQYDEGHFGVRLAVPGWGPLDFGNGRTHGEQRAWPKKERRPRPESSGDGPLLGRRIAFMGAGQSPLPAELAALGAKIVAGVGKTTTDLIVVGGEPPFTIGTRRSRTYVAAIEAAESGQAIRIWGEDEFRKSIASAEGGTDTA